MSAGLQSPLMAQSCMASCRAHSSAAPVDPLVPVLLPPSGLGPVPVPEPAKGAQCGTQVATQVVSCCIAFAQFSFTFHMSNPQLLLSAVPSAPCGRLGSGS